MPTLIQLAAETLRRPLDLVDAVAEDRSRLAHVMPRLVLLVFLGGGVFGGVVGIHRGGLQMLYAALKVPLLLLVPPLIVLPAARALVAMDGGQITPQRLALACMVGMCRTAILSTALTPPLWVLYRADLDHRTALLIMLGSLALVGLPGLLTVARAILPDARSRRSQLALVAVLGLTLGQTGWLLRPFTSTHGAGYPLLCPVDQDIFKGLAKHLGSRRDVGSDWDCREPLYLGGRP